MANVSGATVTLITTRLHCAFPGRLAAIVHVIGLISDRLLSYTQPTRFRRTRNMLFRRAFALVAVLRENGYRFRARAREQSVRRRYTRRQTRGVWGARDAYGTDNILHPRVYCNQTVAIIKN